nr:MAG TPA: hypothetical protein [Caudoviricetes sp.]DAU31553.1 MAG TPA: hypothetical protein [Caudoviricetes sp.]
MLSRPVHRCPDRLLSRLREYRRELHYQPHRADRPGLRP